MSASAFPTMTLRLRDQGYPEDVMQGEIGLTKRELFAAMAMQGIASNVTLMEGALEIAHTSGKTVGQAIAVGAVRYADALIAELEKTND